MSAPKSLFPRVAEGLRHRLINTAPGLLALLLSGYAYSRTGNVLDLAPVVASVAGVALGFMAPIILTAGWNKPIPGAGHLALCSKAVQHVLLLVALLGVALPALVRGMDRL